MKSVRKPPTGKFMLWVDDDQMMLSRTASRLIEAKISYFIAPDVDFAVEVVEEFHISLTGIVIDVMMDPGEALRGEAHDGGFETGYRFVDLLQTDQRFLDINLFLFTNRGTSPKEYISNTTSRSFPVFKKFDYRSRAFVELCRSQFKINS